MKLHLLSLEKKNDDVLSYEGEMKDGLKEGKGNITYKNGDKYTGDFKQNLKDGNGVYFYNN